MNRFRDELRGAFDREQSALGDVGDTRQRLVRQALATRDVPASHRPQWAAALAAVLIAAIAITTFALIRGNARSHAVPATTPSPRAQASPTPLRNELSVADSTPIIVYHDPSSFDQIDGITWDGTASGKLLLNTAGFSSNPAANLFVTGNAVRDRKGALVASGTFGFKYFQGMWADDEVHLCVMTPFNNPGGTGLQTTLQLVDAHTASTRTVVRVGTLYNQTTMTVAACSTEFDRAVVVQSAGQGIGTAQYWVVELSSGKILWTHNFQESTAPPVRVVSSRDGQTIAEVQGQDSTLFGLDGRAIGHMAGAVQTFCWDGSLALVDAANGGGPATIVRVSDGSIVWSGPSGPGFYVYSYAAQPDGADLAIGISNPAYPTNGVAGLSAVDLYIVAPDGRVVMEMKNIYW